jgi:glutathione peroxidase
MTDIYDFEANTLEGEPRKLGDWRGQALLIVNVASKCGFTPQYTGLEALYRERKDQGFAILGFPCDQFGHQEPGDAEAIRNFCSLNYEVSFPLFAKIEVNGEGAHPLYRFLKEQCPGVLGSQPIKWNFTKFLVDRQGKAVSRYAPTTMPKALTEHIEALL